MMAAASAPRLTGGLFASVLLHGGVVALLVFFAAPRPSAPSPPLYQVHLIAAPAGDRAAGVVGAARDAAGRSPPPFPRRRRRRKSNRRRTRRPSRRRVAKAATPVPQPKVAEPPKPETPPPTAGGGATGGKGTDVANVDTPGIEFPYPGYLQNISREVLRQFQTQQTRLTLTADVSFRDQARRHRRSGSIRLVTPSGNYSFDQKALGAVEAAANAKRFGRLPDGFREDILPVTFRFTPSLR